MPLLRSISELPRVPSVYAMYGGQGQGSHVAYVGIASNLKNRIIQHLVRRDSSVATGTSAVVLNPDFVTEVQWWENLKFKERHMLEAAELIAFDVLNPALRSRGKAQKNAELLYTDDNFRKEMRSLFSSKPTGRLILPSLNDALDRIKTLEKKVARLENLLAQEED